MNIRIDDVLTWKWDLPPDLSEASKKDYPSEVEAIGVLQEAKKWLVTYDPENANKINLLFDTKIKHLRSDYFPATYPNWIWIEDKLFKGPCFHYCPYPSLLFLHGKMKVRGGNDQNLLIPILKKIAADPKAVQAMERMKIPLPQKITLKNWSLFLYLMDAKIEENHLESEVLKKGAVKAWETILSDMMPQKWIAKFESALQSSLIKKRLNKAQLKFPHITRKNCIKIYESLVNVCCRSKNRYLEETLRLIVEEMEPANEKFWRVIEQQKQEQSAEPARKKQRLSGDKAE
jgi:hypothetical protein